MEYESEESHEIKLFLCDTLDNIYLTNCTVLIWLNVDFPDLNIGDVVRGQNILVENTNGIVTLRGDQITLFYKPKPQSINSIKHNYHLYFNVMPNIVIQCLKKFAGLLLDPGDSNRVLYLTEHIIPAIQIYYQNHPTVNLLRKIQNDVDKTIFTTDNVCRLNIRSIDSEKATICLQAITVNCKSYLITTVSSDIGVLVLENKWFYIKNLQCFPSSHCLEHAYSIIQITSFNIIPDYFMYVF
jgi:hypothetical protein